MHNPTEPHDPYLEDHEHHKTCLYHSKVCKTCLTLTPNIDKLTAEMYSKVSRAGPHFAEGTNTYKRPTYRHTAKPPWVDFEKQRELVPGESVEVMPGVTYTAQEGNTNPIRLQEKLTTCRITFEDREPERSDSGKAITIHQCEAHLVIVTWDES